MFKKNKDDKNLDIEGLNYVIGISTKIFKIGYIITIIALIALVLYLLRTLSIFKIIKELLIVISPVFIGLIIAWLLDPIVNFLQNKKIPRILSCILVYLVFLGLIVILLVVMMPSFITQIKDFVNTIPSILNDLKTFITNMVNSFSGDIDLSYVKKQLFSSLNSLGNNLTQNIPNMLVSIATKLVSGGMFLILGLMVGFY